jgi:hypothetical protein
LTGFAIFTSDEPTGSTAGGQSGTGPTKACGTEPTKDKDRGSGGFLDSGGFFAVGARAPPTLAAGTLASELDPTGAGKLTDGDPFAVLCMGTGAKPRSGGGLELTNPCELCVSSCNHPNSAQWAAQ